MLPDFIRAVREIQLCAVNVRVLGIQITGRVIETPKLRSAVEFKITRRKSPYVCRLIRKVHPKS